MKKQTAGRFQDSDLNIGCRAVPKRERIKEWYLVRWKTEEMIHSVWDMDWRVWSTSRIARWRWQVTTEISKSDLRKEISAGTVDENQAGDRNHGEEESCPGRWAGGSNSQLENLEITQVPHSSAAELYPWPAAQRLGPARMTMVHMEINLGPSFHQDVL